jgi:hypothetical protein
LLTLHASYQERLNLDIRQRVAAVGRRVNTLCQGEDGLRHQLALYHTYDHFGLPHTSLRQPLPQPVATNGTGSGKLWQPWTPAMAAGLTDPVWTLREVLLYRGPPGLQPLIRGGFLKSDMASRLTAYCGKLQNPQP